MREILFSIFLHALLGYDLIAAEPIQLVNRPRAGCNADNLLRALRNPTQSSTASIFCSSYIQVTKTVTTTLSLEPSTTVLQTSLINATSIVVFSSNSTVTITAFTLPPFTPPSSSIPSTSGGNLASTFTSPSSSEPELSTLSAVPGNSSTISVSLTTSLESSSILGTSTMVSSTLTLPNDGSFASTSSAPYPLTNSSTSILGPTGLTAFPSSKSSAETLLLSANSSTTSIAAISSSESSSNPTSSIPFQLSNSTTINPSPISSIAFPSSEASIESSSSTSSVPYPLSNSTTLTVGPTAFPSPTSSALNGSTITNTTSLQLSSASTSGSFTYFLNSTIIATPTFNSSIDLSSTTSYILPSPSEGNSSIITTSTSNSLTIQPYFPNTTSSSQHPYYSNTTSILQNTSTPDPSPPYPPYSYSPPTSLYADIEARATLAQAASTPLSSQLATYPATRLSSACSCLLTAAPVPTKTETAVVTLGRGVGVTSIITQIVTMEQTTTFGGTSTIVVTLK